MGVVMTVPKYNCQKVMTQFKNNHGAIQISNLVTIGATNMINADGKLIPAKENLAVNFHPFWSDIVSYKPASSPLSTTPIPSTTSDEALDDLVDRINAHLNEDCFRAKECVDLDNPARGCGAGYTKVGYDRGGCVSAHPPVQNEFGSRGPEIPS